MMIITLIIVIMTMIMIIILVTEDLGPGHRRAQRRALGALDAESVLHAPAYRGVARELVWINPQPSIPQSLNP